MKKAISSILITLLIMILPALSAANSSAFAHHVDASSFTDIVDHHSHEYEGVAHQNGHGCCYGHVQVFSLPTSLVPPRYSSSSASHLTEYCFVVATMSYFPEFRPPIA
jgi:hypothetical protein